MSLAMRQAVADMEAAMQRLNKAGEGVPYRPHGFTNVRKQLARRVAQFVVELENSASLFVENNELIGASEKELEKLIV